jgi:hypothetical protein
VFEALAAMTHARLGRGHLDRRDQRRAHRRQPAAAARRAPARVLGRRLVVSVRARRCRRLRRLDGARDAFNETNATIAMLFGVAASSRRASGGAVPAARNAARRSATTTPRRCASRSSA